MSAEGRGQRVGARHTLSKAVLSLSRRDAKYKGTRATQGCKGIGGSLAMPAEESPAPLNMGDFVGRNSSSLIFFFFFWVWGDFISDFRVHWCLMMTNSINVHKDLQCY